MTAVIYMYIQRFRVHKGCTAQCTEVQFSLDTSLKSKTFEEGKLSLESWLLKYLFLLSYGKIPPSPPKTWGILCDPCPGQKGSFIHFVGKLQHAVMCCAAWSFHACVYLLSLEEHCCPNKLPFFTRPYV